jgi:DNA polymerase III, alpha subunit
MDSIPMYVANKNNPSMVKYKHPMLEHILNMTYGCIVYQEQVMQIVRELGGYSLGRADLVRRAMSKKKADVMQKERQNFIYGTDEGGVHVDGAVARGIDEKTAASIFDEMMDFASYAFNKSHAAAYAVVAYRTAWLKCHYPVEFFAALLTSFIDNASKISKYIEVVKRLGIEMLPPSINKSGKDFSVDNGCLRFGLAAVKNVGGAVVDEIAAERETGGDFIGLTDFCKRMVSRKMNKRVVESLIKCGAFDEFGLKRAQLFRAYERVMDDAQYAAKNTMPGQLDMFSMMSGEAERNADNFEDCREFPETELLAMEKESIGMYVSGHPLDSKAAAVRAASTASISDIIENEDKRFNIGSQVTVSGIITKVRNQLTKKGDMMRYVEFEDLTASMEVIIFPGQLRRFADIAVEGSIVTISGNLDISDDAPPKLRLEDMRMLDETARKRARLYLRLDSTDTVVLNEVKRILKAESGDVSVVIKYSDNGQVVAAPKSMMVKRNDERTEILKKLLGDENVRLVEK